MIHLHSLQKKKGTGASILSALSNLPSLPWWARTKIERHLQMISVYQWVITFLILGITCTIGLSYIFFTNYWPISALYFSWLVFDWNTPKQGGRRSEWVRNWAVWRSFREYFPIRLVKTHNLVPTRNYIFGYHPHGIFCFGGFCNFGTEATGFSNKFPGIRPFLATLAGNFRMPILRDYLMSGGERANETTFSTQAWPLALIKVCQKVVGADLVPVYTFGENEVYRQIIFKEGSLMRAIQKKFQKLIGFAPCVFQGRGFFSSSSWGLVPYAKPICTVVGEPITVPRIENPSAEDVDIYHQMYIRSLAKLFNKHKTKFGCSESDWLEVV
uniref:diacylglycerol O-acyltransferase 2 n=1 Tax=Pristiophorus japonicus TaxID=55135 RepID=UPI00398EAD0B